VEGQSEEQVVSGQPVDLDVRLRLVDGVAREFDLSPQLVFG
jgi:hypothetical protein